MTTPHLSELIDQYLLGKISPEDRLFLEQLMESDPNVAEKVKESQQAYNIILSERNRLLKEKLQELDDQKPKSSGWLSRLMISLAVFLLLILCTWYWCAIHLHPSALAHRYFEAGLLSKHQLNENEKLEEMGLLADSVFLEGNYEKAIQVYDTWMQESNNSLNTEARWNKLLALLALEGPTSVWKNDMIGFLQTAPEPLKSKGEKILHLLNSSFYELVCIKIENLLTSLKPKLI